ncbi:MAG TPA: hypothetical protein VKY38_09025 [Azoarcus sp.]|nr:hypothetical protein [Azoarcus sp.]
MLTIRHLILAAATALAVAGCVTINIYFPAAAAERAADRIIDEVWQIRGGASATEGAAEDSGGLQ